MGPEENRETISDTRPDSDLLICVSADHIEFRNLRTISLANGHSMMPKVGDSRRINVFFYGLFMDDELLRAKGVQATHSRIASVEGYALRIRERATLVPDKSGRVYGSIKELSHTEIDHLYSESSVNGYRPEAVLAQLTDGSKFPALCFNLPDTTDKALPNLEYAAKLRELARRLGLPSTYVENIK